MLFIYGGKFVMYCGSGPFLDPPLEDKGGWIFGEVLKHNAKMSNSIIKVMADASQQTLNEEINHLG